MADSNWMRYVKPEKRVEEERTSWIQGVANLFSDPLKAPREMLKAGISPEESELLARLEIYNNPEVRKSMNKAEQFGADLASTATGLMTFLPNAVTHPIETATSIPGWLADAGKDLAFISAVSKGYDPALLEMQTEHFKGESEKWSNYTLGTLANSYFALATVFGVAARAGGYARAKVDNINYGKAKGQYAKMVKDGGLTFEQAVELWDQRFPNMKIKERMGLKEMGTVVPEETNPGSSQQFYRDRTPISRRETTLAEDASVKSQNINKLREASRLLGERKLLEQQPNFTVRDRNPGEVFPFERKARDNFINDPGVKMLPEGQGFTFRDRAPGEIFPGEKKSLVEKTKQESIHERKLAEAENRIKAEEVARERMIKQAVEDGKSVPLVALNEFAQKGRQWAIDAMGTKRHSGLHPMSIVEDIATGKSYAPDWVVRMLRTSTDKTFKKYAGEYLDLVRKQEAEYNKLNQKASSWEGKYAEKELEDAGAIVENTYNLRTGVKPKPSSRLSGLVNEYKSYIEQLRKDINNYIGDLNEGDYIQFLKSYLPHFYTKASVKKFLNGGRWLKNSPNAKARKIPTLTDPMVKESGLVPLTQNIATLTKMWGEINWKVATSKRVAYLLRGVVDANGEPMIRPGKVDGWWHTDNAIVKKIYSRKNSKGQTVQFEGGVSFHPDIAPIAKQAFQNPMASRGAIGKAYDQVSALMKAGQLSLSLFHHVALTESALSTLGTASNPLRGIFLFGKEARAVRGRPFEFTAKAGNILKERNGIAEDAILHGLQNASAKTDVGYDILSKTMMNLEAKARNVPYLRGITRFNRKAFQWWNRKLWDEYHQPLKLYSYYKLTGDILKKAKDLDPAQIKATKQKIASFVNDAFGGQEWEAMFNISPKNRMLLRRAFLAPDWTLSNLKIAGRLVGDIKDPVMRNLTYRYWRNMASTLLISTQALNYALNKKFTWDNEYGHKWDIDITPIVKNLPRWDTSSGQRYYIHFGKQAREVLNWLEDPPTGALKEIYVKMNPAAREMIRQFWGSDFEGYPYKRGLKSALKVFRPFSTRSNNFMFSVPASKGMTKWKAINAFREALNAKTFDITNLFKESKRHTRSDAIKAISEACRLNGLDPEPLFTSALSDVRGGYYKEFYEGIENKDIERINKSAVELKRLKAEWPNLKQSLKRRGANDTQLKAAEVMYERVGG